MIANERDKSLTGTGQGIQIGFEPLLIAFSRDIPAAQINGMFTMSV